MDKTVIEIMTKAIFDSQVKSAREEIDRVGVGLSDAEQFFLGLRGETDAALVVLIASYIDANLSDAWKRNMPGKSAATYELLFDNSGPLATMSSKVRLAHALSWLTDQTSADLHILRKIRNRFAHDPYKQAITDPEIVSLVESLSPREDYCKSALVAHGEKIVDLTPRIKFHTRAALISFAAAIELVAAPIVVVHGVPMCAVMHDYDNSPETKRQIAWSMTRVTFSLLTGKTDWE